MKVKTIASLLALAGGLMLNGAAQAAVIYSNGAPVADSFRCAEDSGACGGSWTLFDNFTLSSAQTVYGINWTAVLYGGLGDFNGGRAWIYSADPVFGGGSLLHTIALQSGAPTAGILGVNSYDVHLTDLNISLAAGTYWLGIQNDTNASYGTVACTNCGSGDGTQWQNNGTGARIPQNKEFAFTIEGGGTVPEPASLALFGIGLAGIGFGRRRRSN